MVKSGQFLLDLLVLLLVEDLGVGLALFILGLVFHEVAFEFAGVVHGGPAHQGLVVLEVGELVPFYVLVDRFCYLTVLHFYIIMFKLDF